MAWRICCILVIALSIFSFTPAVVPAGVFEPTLFGMPRTLWLGLLVSLAYVGLTLAGAFSHPGIRRDVSESLLRDPRQDEGIEP